MTNKYRHYNNRFPKEEEKVEDAITEELKEEAEETKIKEVEEESVVTNIPEEKKAIVTADRLNVRSAPEITADNVIGIIKKDTEVTVYTIGTPVGWLNVSAEIAPGVIARGYVMEEFLKEV